MTTPADPRAVFEAALKDALNGLQTPTATRGKQERHDQIMTACDQAVAAGVREALLALADDLDAESRTKVYDISRGAFQAAASLARRKAGAP